MRDKRQASRISMRNFAFHGIRFKMIALTFIVSTLFIVVAEFVILHTVEDTVENLLTYNMKEGGFYYLKSLLGSDDWYIQNGALYCGEVFIGDGIPEHANLKPFFKLQEYTDWFSYAFICTDETATPGKEKGSMQKRFMRVAGSSLDPDGKPIVGSYLNPKVTQSLYMRGEYVGYVDSLREFCVYRALKSADGTMIGSIAIGCRTDALQKAVSKDGVTLFIIIFLMMQLMIGFLSWRMFHWIKKLDKANQYLCEIANGDFPAEPLNLHTKDELVLTEQCINEMTISLQERERINHDLKAAAHIQERMLPHTFPPFPEHDEFDIFAITFPSREVGGDFYDFFMPDEQHICVAIADVSGRGIPAALLMTVSKVLLKNYGKMGFPPGEVFTQVNRLLCEDNTDYMFVTAWIGVLDITNGKLTYANAGHNPPALRQANGQFTFLEAPPGLMLSVLDDMVYEQHELTMQPGDRLFLYTDGVTENENGDKQFYGTKRLEDYLNQHIAENAEKVLLDLKTELDDFAGDREPKDDITMLMLDYRGKQQAVQENLV